MSKTAQEWADEILDIAYMNVEAAEFAMEDGAFLSGIGFPDDQKLAEKVSNLISAETT